MKKTEYFLSNNRNNGSAKVAMDEVIEQKNAFISKNEGNIGSIENEDLQIIPLNPQTLYALLKLTYFPKSK
jgi:hypothetical protein